MIDHKMTIEYRVADFGRALLLDKVWSERDRYVIRYETK